MSDTSAKRPETADATWNWTGAPDLESAVHRLMPSFAQLQEHRPTTAWRFEVNKIVCTFLASCIV